MSDDKRKIGKVTSSSAGTGGVAGALTMLGVWVASLRGVDVPPEVASAFTVIISFIGAMIGGWIVKPGDGKRRADG